MRNHFSTGVYKTQASCKVFPSTSIVVANFTGFTKKSQLDFQKKLNLWNEVPMLFEMLASFLPTRNRHSLFLSLSYESSISLMIISALRHQKLKHRFLYKQQTKALVFFRVFGCANAFIQLIKINVLSRPLKIQRSIRTSLQENSRTI